MNRIQKVSRWMVIIFNVVLVMMPFKILLMAGVFNPLLAKGFAWLGYPMPLMWTPGGSIDVLNVHRTWVSQSIAMLSAMICVFPLVLGTLCLNCIFKAYQKGDIFSEKNVINYRRIGVVLLIDGLLIGPLGNMLMILALTLSNEVGNRWISIGYGEFNFLETFSGMIVIVIAWVMLEGSRLHEENKLTV